MSGLTIDRLRGGLLDLLDDGPTPPAETKVEVRTIVQLYADTGSDTWPYREDPRYNVITIGADIGVENYHPVGKIHGIIANPVCTELTPAKHGRQFGGGERPARDLEKAFWHVKECLRVIDEAKPAWYAIENPASGLMREYLGAPTFSYEPWQFGSPWTKRTALWGNFSAPLPIYENWDDVPKLPDLYARPGSTPLAGVSAQVGVQQDPRVLRVGHAGADDRHGVAVAVFAGFRSRIQGGKSVTTNQANRGSEES